MEDKILKNFYIDQEGNKRCAKCKAILYRIWYTAMMTEEWTDNGYYWECSARHSLETDWDQPVLCPECETVVGTGIDFGFTEHRKYEGVKSDRHKIKKE